MSRHRRSTITDLVRVRLTTRTAADIVCVIAGIVDAASNALYGLARRIYRLADRIDR